MLLQKAADIQRLPERKKDGKDELHQKETGAAGRMFLHGTLLSDAITELSVPEVSTAVNR